MDLKDCAKFANENKFCFLATVDGDQPRVRMMGMWYADATGFYFQSQSVKALCHQLEKNPKVEVCFHSKDHSRMLRVFGRVRFITDEKVRARCIAERPFVVKDFGVTGPKDPLLAVFHLYTGEAYFWERSDSMKEASIPRIRF